MVLQNQSYGVFGLIQRRVQAHRDMAERARKNVDMLQLSYTLASITMILGVLDVFSTNLGLAAGAVEQNPLILGMMGTVGVYYFIPKLLLTSVVASMIIWSPTRLTLALMALYSGWMTSVVTNNFMFGLGYGLS